jgi:flagellar P-ring protein precursor FlgI
LTRTLKMRAAFVLAGASLLLASAAGVALADRIKDIAAFQGDRPLPLVGYGLVVGLSGTGDGGGSQFTSQSLAAMLEQLGLTVDPARLRARNVAAVIVTCDLWPGVNEETAVDVAVASIGDASSLQGGTLLMTPMRGPDGDVYVVAQGAVSIGGYNAEGGANNRIQKNHSTAGQVPSGGRVARRALGYEILAGMVRLALHHPDLNTAQRIAECVNGRFTGAALAQDAGTVQLNVPVAYAANPVAFLAEVGELRAEPDARARVVINEKTGTIVVGAGVTLGEAALAHGSLSIEIRTQYGVSQPNSFNESGKTVVVPDVQTSVEEGAAHVMRVGASTTINDVVNVLNEMGATPRDIIAILEALRASGALQAELVVL